MSLTLAAQLESQGHDLLTGCEYTAAVPILKRAMAATVKHVSACVDPDSTMCLTYAYALYDLGRALRLSGDPTAAVPILEARLEIDNHVRRPWLNPPSPARAPPDEVAGSRPRTPADPGGPHATVTGSPCEAPATWRAVAAVRATTTYEPGLRDPNPVAKAPEAPEAREPANGCRRPPTTRYRSTITGRPAGETVPVTATGDEDTRLTVSTGATDSATTLDTAAGDGWCRARNITFCAGVSVKFQAPLPSVVVVAIVVATPCTPTDWSSIGSAARPAPERSVSRPPMVAVGRR